MEEQLWEPKYNLNLKKEEYTRVQELKENIRMFLVEIRILRG